jgi:hypothetical protein
VNRIDADPRQRWNVLDPNPTAGLNLDPPSGLLDQRGQTVQPLDGPRGPTRSQDTSDAEVDELLKGHSRIRHHIEGPVESHRSPTSRRDKPTHRGHVDRILGRQSPNHNSSSAQGDRPGRIIAGQSDFRACIDKPPSPRPDQGVNRQPHSRRRGDSTRRRS